MESFFIGLNPQKVVALLCYFFAASFIFPPFANNVLFNVPTRQLGW